MQNGKTTELLKEKIFDEEKTRMNKHYKAGISKAFAQRTFKDA